MCIDPHVSHSQAQRDNPLLLDSHFTNHPTSVPPIPSKSCLSSLSFLPHLWHQALHKNVITQLITQNLLTAKLSEHFSVPLTLDFIAELKAADHHSFSLLFTCPCTRPWGSKETLIEILCFFDISTSLFPAFSWNCSHRFTFFCYQ